MLSGTRRAASFLDGFDCLVQQVDVYHAKLGDAMHPKPVSHTPLKSITHGVQR